jgi:dUTP pyrophosphatase
LKTLIAPMDTLKFQKLHARAILPFRGSQEACGLDIFSIEDITLRSLDRAAIKTGFAVEIPHGFYGRIAPRSGLALKAGIDVLAGVIDSDYRGEIRCILINLGSEEVSIRAGDRIAQLIVESISVLSPVWTNNLTDSKRNQDGFGSSG